MTRDLTEIDISRLRVTLDGAPIGHTVEYVRVVDSSMRIAHELAQDAAVRAGHVVTTEEQTAGKGRRGRQWLAPYATSLLVSVVLKPPLLPHELAQIPMAAALAVADALAETEPELAGRIALKWPNDVLVISQTVAGQVAGKVAGILVESAVANGEATYAVLGIGVNVNQLSSQLPPVTVRMSAPASLRSVLGRPVDRTQLLATLCTRLALRFAPEQRPNERFYAWRSRLATLGQHVFVYAALDSDAPTLSGLAVDVTENGELLVQDAAGTVHTISAADVSVRIAP